MADTEPEIQPESGPEKTEPQETREPTPPGEKEANKPPSPKPDQEESSEVAPPLVSKEQETKDEPKEARPESKGTKVKLYKFKYRYISDIYIITISHIYIIDIITI